MSNLEMSIDLDGLVKASTIAILRVSLCKVMNSLPLI